ncbi:MAG: 3-deoxy-D-manno-octulosonate 8-phosphate phosphatase [Candidatus Aminicenantes bacterium RBG_19FT_COMBO_58_17]|jgi:3-deoxy-D-manno-octulosonate 8-phosphate phosphatase (KDO 8-P phosphatase)|nr:MAG: 3-deoxy-D-manno-octulosonate 8-phosphate phosphatase [Candidatus Aminicenantes bacterium RBG_19FT_COMBO_58_17]
MLDGKARALRIKMIIMDVDGTLTDGALFVLPDGEEVKSYNVRDGLGILLAHLAGFKTAIITGKTSRALEKRAEKLRIDELHQGILDKKPVLEAILAKHGLKNEEAAYIGDDLGDLAVIKAVGLAGAVADAHPEVKKNCHFISQQSGGRGAVREFIEFILDAQGKWGEVEEKVKSLSVRNIG